MSLFQTQVEREYISGITTDLNPIYDKYLAYFGNEERQANIRQVSEEQYQGEFIRALFVDILGYTAQPEPNYNLLREKKNETDSKSADAALLINQQVIGVVELKDHKTQDLKKVEVQAFGYKNNHRNCHYVVTSNFERLRFYIDNAVEFIEFDLFHLSFDEFRRLWICLSYESIAKNLPQELKKQSISNEDIITKKLYKDYSVFKRQLFDNIVSLNPAYDKLLLFKKTQKLLDRYLFLFFAEDKGLLPANSVQGTVEKWIKYNADPMNDYQSLYSRFVKYFHLLNVGYKDAHIEIYAYNGGLFANDEVLNDIKIDDKILSEHVLTLARYDYDTDVDVNILGHIFENSLNEIEEVANELTTGVKTTSKRKQDGVFYTPRYITQYIVENTVGRLCEEKKAALGIGEELFEYKRKDKKKEALKIFDVYREWLLQITILDPACGSGAFLNMALEFLIAEHKWIDDQQEKIAGLKNHYSMELSNIENSILENNLFGVDINEESVEIAKLSLWLRTAKPHRKLTSLNNNIKCGNSLIDDPAIAGDKAFNWEKEFPQVFGRKASEEQTVVFKKDETPDYLKLIKEKTAEAQQKAEQGIALSKEALEISKQLAEYAEKLESVTASEAEASYGNEKRGFDVVIGNPPYVRLETMKELSEQMSKLNNKTFEKRGDLYCLFVEKGFNLLRAGGVISFIMPNKWLQAGYGKSLREYFLKYELNQLIDFGDIQIFEGATTYPCIFVSRKESPKKEFTVSVLSDANNEDFNSNVINSSEIFQTNHFSGETWVISSGKEKKLLEKLGSKFTTLSDYVGGESYRGVLTGLTEAFLVDKETKNRLVKEDTKANEIIFPVIRGRDIKPWIGLSDDCFLIGTFPALKLDIENYLSVKKHFVDFGQKRLEQTGEKGSRKKTSNKWFETQDTINYYQEFAKPKIMYQKFQVKPCFIYDEQGLYCNDSMWIIPTNDKGLLAILNSKLGW
ncbi:MAG: Eco57I restriction-modification methylase domain-containing protein [Bacteroidales bacterium]